VAERMRVSARLGFALHRFAVEQKAGAATHHTFTVALTYGM
jgi:hypothetical protein